MLVDKASVLFKTFTVCTPWGKLSTNKYSLSVVAVFKVTTLLLVSVSSSTKTDTFVLPYQAPYQASKVAYNFVP